MNGAFPVSDTGQTVAAPGWRFEKPARGYWTATLSKKDGSAFLDSEIAAPTAGHPDAYLFLWNESPEQVFSHMGTYSWTINSTVGVTAHLINKPANRKLQRGERPAVFVEPHITTAQADIYMPDGTETILDMKDDGQSFDLLAGDGVYGAAFSTPQAGVYRITTLFEGTLADGTPFMRSAEHAMAAVEDEVNIPSGARAFFEPVSAASTNDQVTISIPVTAQTGRQLRAYAEVYGTVAGTSEQKPACWIGGYVVVEDNQVDLELNKRWLVTAGVEAPLYLKQVTLYDGDYHIPLATAAVLPVSQGGASLQGVVAKLNLAATKPALKPTREMRHGVRPAHLTPEAAAAKRAAKKAQNNTELPNLVLLHGYCAADNPWVRTPTVPFTEYTAFEGLLGESKLNDEYAKKVIDSYEHLPSFGLIGHSQGGMVSLHIRNFYWSGNDAASAPAGSAAHRPVQSMGTPYLGVSGAGAALDLGALFGLGCGNNFDLTLDGANLWLAGLEDESTRDTYYYTTVYKYTFLHPRYCSLATNLVLQWPNDGTAEYDQCLLQRGATHVSNTEGECHSVNMKWPPQTDNVERNAEMNAAAMR